MIAGSALFTVGDEVIRGVPGTALFLPAGVPHRIENDGGERLHVAWVFDRPSWRTSGSSGMSDATLLDGDLMVERAVPAAGIRHLHGRGWAGLTGGVRG